MLNVDMVVSVERDDVCGGYEVYSVVKGEVKKFVLFGYDFGDSLGSIEIVEEKEGGEFSGYVCSGEKLEDVFDKKEISYLWGMGWLDEDWEEEE